MASIPWLAHATWRYLSTSQFFAVQDIEVEGNKILKKDHIVSIVRDVGGENVLQVRKEAIKTELLKTGWIRSASIHRDLPNTITVRLQEYEPVATIMLDRMYLLDKRGLVFRAVEPGDPIVRPLLTGFTNPKNAYEKRILQRSLTLNEVYTASGLNDFDEIALIHHDPAKGYSMITEQNQIIVNLGHEDFPKRVQKIRFVIRDSIQRTGMPPKVIHADLDNNQVVILPKSRQTRRAAHAKNGKKRTTSKKSTRRTMNSKRNSSAPPRVVQR